MADWASVKRAARAERATLGKPPSRIVTNFTDCQPLIGWDTGHAMRELWQNFRDGLRARFSPAATVAVHRVHANLFEARLAPSGRVVGSLAVDPVAETLVLRQAECILGIECLDLASSKRGAQGAPVVAGEAGAIGGHGEGFKLGINLLLCKGFSVRYEMADQTWEFSLSRERSTRHNNMCVDVSPGPDRDELVITISGPGVDTLFDPDMDLDLYTPCVVLCDAPDAGQILRSPERPDMNGRVYCRRLFVGYDENLRALKVGVNLNLQIARDRHLVPNNMWPTIQRVLEIVCAQYKADRVKNAGLAAVFEHLLALLTAGTEAQYRHQLPFVKPVLRQYVALQRNAPDVDHIMFLGQPSEHAQTLLKDLDYTVVTPAGALADPVNLEELMTQFIDRARPADVAALSPERKRGLEALKNLYHTFAISCDALEPSIIVKVLPGHIAARTPKLYGNDFHVVVDITCLDDETAVAYAAQDSLRQFQRFRSYTDENKVLSRVVTDFVRGPFRFVARKYVPVAVTVAAAAGSSSGAGGAPETGAGGGGGSSSSSAGSAAASGSSGHGSTTMPVHGSGASGGTSGGNVVNDRAAWLATPPRDTSAHSITAQVRDYRIANEPSTDFDVDNDKDTQEEGPRAPCVDYRGELVPAVLGEADVTVWVDVLGVTHLAEGMARQIDAQLPRIAKAIAHFERTIPAALGTTVDHVPIRIVAVAPQLLGFTKAGWIYLNVVPLVGMANAAELNRSIFFTLVHELTHRAHTAHNTYFADDMAKLVWELHGCLASLK